MSTERSISHGTESPSQRITKEVTSWPGVTAEHGSRGELSFKLGRREIGHLHGDWAAHFGFPKPLGAELREQGRVGPHPVDPSSPGWAARNIEDESDITEVIALLRLNYDRMVSRHGVPDATGEDAV
jgi:hypothetical protein